MPITIGRNDPCHCGSGKKYKKCHLESDEKSDRKEREKAALNAAKIAAEKSKEEEKSNPSQPKKPVEVQKQGWMGKMANKVGFFRNITQRRTGPSGKSG
jgi:hypothetical protein